MFRSAKSSFLSFEKVGAFAARPGRGLLWATLIPPEPRLSRSKPARAWARRGLVLLLGGAVLSGHAQVFGQDTAITTSVFAKADKSYQRKKGADGKWAREYYAMSNGGLLPGTSRDATMEKVHFAALAGILAEHLARQGYFPATEGVEPSLLVVIHWGTTIPFSDGTYRSGIQNLAGSMNALSEMNRSSAFRADASPTTGSEAPPSAGISLTGSVEDMERQAAADAVASQMITQEMFNRARDQANERNARLLGYLNDINESNGIQRFAGGGHRYDDLVADIEESRYYVIISAYDFAKTVRQKQPKLLWVTRVSIRSQGNNFGDRMATMVANAAKFFGQESGRLVRQYERRGKVEIGEATVVGTVSEQGVEAAAKQRAEEQRGAEADKPPPRKR